MNRLHAIDESINQLVEHSLLNEDQKRQREVSYKYVIVQNKLQLPEMDGSNFELKLDIHKLEADQFIMHVKSDSNQDCRMIYDQNKGMLSLHLNQLVNQLQVSKENLRNLSCIIANGGIKVVLPNQESIQLGDLNQEHKQIIFEVVNGILFINKIQKWEL